MNRVSRSKQSIALALMLGVYSLCGCGTAGEILVVDFHHPSAADFDLCVVDTVYLKALTSTALPYKAGTLEGICLEDLVYGHAVMSGRSGAAVVLTGRAGKVRSDGGVLVSTEVTAYRVEKETELGRSVERFRDPERGKDYDMETDVVFARKTVYLTIRYTIEALSSERLLFTRDFSVKRIGTGKKVVDQYFGRDTELGKVIDNTLFSNEKEARDAALASISLKEVVREAVRILNHTFMTELCTYTTSEERLIMRGGCSTLKTAYSLAMSGDWEGAGALWEEAVGAEVCRKDRSAASYNLGLFYESMDRHIEAGALFAEAAKLSEESFFEDYLTEYKKRRRTDATPPPL